MQLENEVYPLKANFEETKKEQFAEIPPIESLYDTLADATFEEAAGKYNLRVVKPKIKNNIHDGHRERQREKYLRSGLDSFAEHELLEMILFYCVSRGDVNPLAHRLIDTYGSLSALMDAFPEEIVKRCGISISTAILITLFPKMYKRYETSKWDKRLPINNSKKAAAYLYSLFANEINECMYLLCLDNSHQLITAALLSRGTINEATVYPRTVVQTVLNHNAAYVILSHNHPSGNLFPSQGDIDSTATVVNALKPINVKVLDHLIIGGRNYYSFSEKKLMNLVYEKE